MHLRLPCWLIAAGLALAVPPARAGLVWRSDFATDGNVDGVAVLRNGPSKTQVSGPSGGFLAVQDWDNITSAYVPDKAGRPLGSIRSGGDSMSVLYRFRWSTLNTSQAHAYELVGFLGDATPQTRQVLGAILRHWRISGVYYVALDAAVGSVGNTSFGYLSGPTVSLGSSATSSFYQLAIGYSGSTHVLTIRLFDANGTLLGSLAPDLDTDVPGLLQPGPASLEYNALALTHVGWSDYTGNGFDRATTWQADYLSYFDTATGAFDAVEGTTPITGACCAPDGSCGDAQTQAACAGAGGTWQGAGATCAATSCPQPPAGACCMPDGTCSNLSSFACTGYWQGAGTTCGQVNCSAFNPDNEPWEVVYTGVDSAADNVPNYLRFDSAIDDDWAQPNCSFKLNTPGAGFMSVDRVTNVADHAKTGNIWLRDPVLSYAAGFTMEVRVLIQANSNTDAFSMTCLDDGTSFGVHLSPNRIKAGNLSAKGTGTTAPLTTTDGYHLYRIVRQPASQSISVYLDGSPRPLITGSGDTSFLAGSTGYLLYPRVLIGDNENDTAYNANYSLDFVRYRRGATAPGQTPAAFPARVLPALPAPPAAAETWTVGYDGVGEPSSSGWIQGGGSVWTQQADGIMELNTLQSAANARIDAVPGWPNRGALTLEARLKVLADSQDGGFNLVFNDQVGAAALVLSAGQAILMHPSMPVGKAVYAMNTTGDFHTYRLTRDTDGLYYHLYIDNRPAPSISYQHVAGDQLSFSRVWFGDIGFPVAANGCHVLIDYVRWHTGAAAPRSECHLPPADGDGDGDVDQADFGAFQSCLSDPTGAVAAGCGCFDFDYNGVVDPADFAVFSACLSGPGAPANPVCGG